MALKQLSAKEIAETIADIIDIINQQADQLDNSDHRQFLTEVQCLEQHTGIKLHKLLDGYHV